MEHTQSAIDKQQWELDNNIRTILDPKLSLNDSSCGISGEEKPWTDDPLYFNRVMISDLALLKMAMHISLCPHTERVGILQGKIDGDAFVVLDAFGLPVEDSEIGVDAKKKVLEYYETRAQAGGLGNVVGWYRADPINGPFLFDTDVSTQMRIQQLKEPSLAIIIEPSLTISFGRVGIGAYRLYPEGYTPPDEPVSKFEYRVSDEIMQRRKLLKKRRALKITYFKSLSDSNLFDDLWNNYWTHIISLSTSTHNRVGPKVPCSGPKSVGRKVSEDKGAPVSYFIHVCHKVTGKYVSDDEVLEAVFAKLMEEIGCSKSKIGPYTRYFFVATLTAEQAGKMSGVDNVIAVRPDVEYRIPEYAVGCRNY
ncbi:hypothetical protein RND81_12G224300 [Saponaria officinalis]